jgi:hypothetical protein
VVATAAAPAAGALSPLQVAAVAVAAVVDGARVVVAAAAVVVAVAAAAVVVAAGAAVVAVAVEAVDPSSPSSPHAARTSVETTRAAARRDRFREMLMVGGTPGAPRAPHLGPRSVVRWCAVRVQFGRPPRHPAEGASVDTIFDLPLHPLLAHFPIVLAPVVVLAAVVAAVRPAWRARLGPVVVGASVVTLVALLLTRRSGEELFDLLEQEPSIGRHRDLGNQSLVLWVLFVVAAVASVMVQRRSGGTSADAGGHGGTDARRAPVAVGVLAALCALVGVVSTVWIARTGHEGAKSHWSFVTEG